MKLRKISASPPVLFDELGWETESYNITEDDDLEPLGGIWTNGHGWNVSLVNLQESLFIHLKRFPTLDEAVDWARTIDWTDVPGDIIDQGFEQDWDKAPYHADYADTKYDA